MAFPTSPTVGQVHATTGVTYVYTAQGAWRAVGQTQVLHAGVGVPTSNVGSLGDYYLDLATGLLYGPMAVGGGGVGAWPTPTKQIAISLYP